LFDYSREKLYERANTTNFMNEQTQPQTRRDIEAHITAKAWKDQAYKRELLSHSKAVIEREFNIQLPAEVNVQVMEENPTSLYFVIPMRPEIPGQEISDEQLQAIAGGGLASQIGASLVVAASAFAVSAAGEALSKNIKA